MCNHRITTALRIRIVMIGLSQFSEILKYCSMVTGGGRVTEASVDSQRETRPLKRVKTK